MTDESVSLVYAECEGATSTAHTEDSEDIEVIMVSRREATRLLKTSNIRFDVKTWIVLNQFSAQGVF
jgi:ADP-ribose pyrophosphatase